MGTFLFDYWVIKHCGLFDPVYYLLTYPDVRIADTDPIKHFVNYGWKEGRNPSESFITTFYVNTNPDVQLAGRNPLVHYVLYGKKEGRVPRPGALPLSSISGVSLFDRTFQKIARKIYQALPLSIMQRERLKKFLIRYFPQVLRLNGFGQGGNYPFHLSSTASNLVDIAQQNPLLSVSKQIAVHVHIFYGELISEFERYLGNMPFDYDLYVSVVSEDVQRLCEQIFARLPNIHKLTVRVVPNRGRDLAPFFCVFGPFLKQYDVVAHFHSKKSLYNRGNTVGWREYLLRELLGSKDQIRRIFNLLLGDNAFGMVYPQTFHLVPYHAHTWLANRGLAEKYRDVLEFHEFPKGYFDFPAGSMFWARKNALEPLFNAGFTMEDFPEEKGQTDGTLAHMLERFLGVSVVNQGMKIAILMDKEYPSWSTWRMNYGLQRNYDDLKDAISNPQIKVIGFDVFDTLLCRPLLDPESTKKIVARRSPQGIGELFLKFRGIAEVMARAKKGMDVGLDDIYESMAEISGIDIQKLSDMRQLEERVESNSVRPRKEGIQLFNDALKSNKPIAIVTDTFLNEQTIGKMLRQAGADGWDSLFVSNSIGIRKDSGQLYDHLNDHYKIHPDEFLMIGDNERSDVQIPSDRGSHLVHFLRPTEIARGTPRLGPLVNLLEKRADLDEELTFGSVLLHNFSPIAYPEFDPSSLFSVTPENVGYSLVGPLLVSFSQWLLEKSRDDTVDRLYFLSREGKLMKEVYDAWTIDKPDAPQSEYLVISRRCSSLAALTSFEDILEIARVTYFPNTLERLLSTRFGIRLSQEKWGQISDALSVDSNSKIEIKDKKIGNLEGVLHLLQGDIYHQAQREKRGLVQRLKELNIQEVNKPAVVDIGYGGSVQGHLNKVLGKQINGYYLLTDDRSCHVADRYDVIIRGCFGENINGRMQAPFMFRNSFEVEKLLSSNEPQIEFYEIENGKAVGRYRPLVPAEIQPANIRNQIHAGAVKYAQDLREIQRTLLPDFRPSVFVATSLMDAFFTNTSEAEKSLLTSIVLDDYYCGRDLVA